MPSPKPTTVQDPAACRSTCAATPKG